MHRQLQALQQENAAIAAATGRDTSGTEKLKSLLDITQQRRMAAETSLAKNAAELASTKARLDRVRADATFHATLESNEAERRSSEIRGLQKQLLARDQVVSQLRASLGELCASSPVSQDTSGSAMRIGHHATGIFSRAVSPSGTCSLTYTEGPALDSVEGVATEVQRRLDASYAQVRSCATNNADAYSIFAGI